MEQEHQVQQWVVEEEEEEEEVEDAALEGRQSRQHGKDSVDGGGHSNGVSSASVETSPDEPPPVDKGGEQEEEVEHAIRKEEDVAEPEIVGNVVENGNNHFKDDCAAVGLGLVAEFAGAATNGEAINSTTAVHVAASQNMRSVYFDKQQGMWKCHHCTWTKRFDSPWTVPVSNLKGYSDLLMNVKTMIQHGPCFVCETKGNEVNGLNGVQIGDGARSVLPTNHGEGEFDILVENSDFPNSLCNEVNNQCTKTVYEKVPSSGNEVNGLNGVQNGDGARSILPKICSEGEFSIQVENSDIQNSPCNEINNQFMKTADDKVPSSSELSHLCNSSEVQATTIENFDDETSAKACPNLIEEIDQQLKELDVEAVLAKQETHDLFCPNCNSCITKRVILRKRKRQVNNLDIKAKRDKLDTVVSSKLVNNFPNEANQGGHAVTTSDVGSLEPPADNFEPEREPEVFRCLSCFSFFIPSGNGLNLFRKFGGACEPETSQIPLIKPASNLENPSNIAVSNSNWFISLFTLKRGQKASDKGDASLEHSRSGSAEQQLPSSITTNMPIFPVFGHPEGPRAATAIIKNVKPILDLNPGHGRLNSQIPSTVKSVKVESLRENDIKSNMASRNEPLAHQKYLNSSFQNDLASIQSFTRRAGDVMNGLEKVGTDLIDFSAKEQLLTENVKTSVRERKNNSVVMIKTDLSEAETVLDKSLVNNADDVVSKHDSVRLATVATTETCFNTGEPAKDAILKSYEGEPEFLVPSTVGSPILETSHKDVDKTPEIVHSSDSSLVQGAPSADQSFGSAVLTNDVASDKQGSGIDALIPSEQDFTLTVKVQKDIEEQINPSAGKENKGSDVIDFVEADTCKSTTSQRADNVPLNSAIVTDTQTQVNIGEQPRAEIGEPREWEIIKSIVYGGLVESITSLGIVSSAAGSGAAPMNLIALGLANLVGGLFIIGHNLIELKNDHSGGDPQRINMQEDRYQEQLGRRANFLLHAVVAVISFLIFGSVPLVIYGLLIRKNYYAEVKLAAVAATSVACVILLAIGKVYTRRPPKSYIKTVLYYVTLALGASGISYIVGELINDLLDKFSHSESGFVITMPFSSARKMRPAWMSY